MRTRDDAGLTAKTGEEGREARAAGSGQSHGDRAVLSLTATPESCPAPFPLRWGEVLDLS